MKNILDIIYDYSKKRKFLDEDAIKKIICNYMDEKNISIINTVNIIYNKEFILTRIYKKISNVLSIKRNDLFNNSILGTYLDDYIDIYYSRIIKIYDTDELIEDSIYEDKLLLYEKIFRFNLYIASIIFHELEHAHQEEIYNTQGLKDIESKLIKLESFYLNNLGNKVLSRCEYNKETNEYEMSNFKRILYILSCIKDQRKYDKNYDISLLERLADIDAQKSVIKTIEEVKKEINNLYCLENEILINRIIRDYPDSKESPTIDFFKNIMGKKALEGINFLKLDLDSRLRLGLEIDDDEYMDTIKLLQHNK